MSRAAPVVREPFPFIVARGRSGTTLLRAMFDSHPDMAVPNESHFVVQLAGRRARYEGGSAGFDLEAFSRDLFDHWAFRRWALPAEEVHAAYRETPPVDYPSAIRLLYATYARHGGRRGTATRRRATSSVSTCWLRRSARRGSST